MTKNKEDKRNKNNVKKKDKNNDRNNVMILSVDQDLEAQVVNKEKDKSLIKERIEIKRDILVKKIEKIKKIKIKIKKEKEILEEIETEEETVKEKEKTITILKITELGEIDDKDEKLTDENVYVSYIHKK